MLGFRTAILGQDLYKFPFANHPDRTQLQKRFYD
jgi:hypothetical protein